MTYNCIANGDLSRDCASDSDTNETVLGYPKNQLNISRLMSWTKYGVSVQIFNSAGASKSSSVVFGLTQEDSKILKNVFLNSLEMFYLSSPITSYVGLRKSIMTMSIIIRYKSS